MKSRTLRFRSSRWSFALAIAAVIFATGCDDDTGTNSITGDAISDGTTSGDGTGNTPADSGNTTPEDAAGDASQTTDCPPYQTRCDGVCIPTSTDPDNCGGCGITCGESEVCSGGTCTEECMPGLEICDRQCVNYGSDNDHCGACGSACGEGEGCVDGSCAPAADLGTRDEACADGGPPIDLGDTVTVERQCSGNLAERTFRWAVCSCEDIDSTGRGDGMFADAYDSSIGPYVPGGEGGGVATNGSLKANSGFYTTGTLWAADQFNSGIAVSTNSAATIGQRLHAGSSVNLGSGTTVGGDAYINGDVADALTIGGTLYAPNSVSVDGGVTYADLQHGPVDVGLPCDACGVDERIPVECQHDRPAQLRIVEGRLGVVLHHVDVQDRRDHVADDVRGLALKLFDERN